MEKRRYAHQILYFIPKIAASLSIALGLVVLVGWYANNVTLIQIFPIFVPMQFNTALGFLICGTGILSPSLGRNRLAMACGLTALVIGVLTLLQYIFNVNLSIDQLLMKHYITVETSHPGRMAPNTALCFAITGTALLILSRAKRTRQNLMVIGILGSITAALGVVSFFGYLSGVDTAYGWGNLTRMAVHTAAGFVALGMGIFAFAWFEGMAKDTWVPNWIAFPAGIGMATVILVEWQALNTKIGAEHSFLPVIVLVPGILMTALLVVTIQLAQTSWRRAKDVERVNWKLENEIIEREQKEEALRESEGKLRAIFEAADSVSFITTDLGTEIGNDTRITGFSPGAEKMFGYREEEVLEKRVAMLHIAEDVETFSEIVDLVKKGEKGYSGETTLVRKSGEHFPVLFTVHALFDSKGEISGTLGVSIDISERQRLEAQLQQAQKMEALGTLAGGVAHDLNNILGGLVSYPELLLLQLPEDSSLRKPILTIQKSGERAAAVVQDLLTLARRGVVVSEVVNPNDIISEYLESPEHENLQSYHPGVHIEILLEKNVLNILGSSTHLSKTVMNLISNAAEAMPEGGKLTVSTENRHIDRPIRGYDNVKEGDYVVLAISDTGTGISPDDIGKIFEPFYTKKKMGRSGTGLGMTVVWGTVKDHNGYIDIQSTEGKGTKFALYFPVTRKELPEDESSLTIESYSGNGESILVVDDVEEQRKIVSGMLKELGYSVVSVSSGEEAVEYLKANKVDLLILDMVMDPGMDGLDTYKKILEIHPGQKAIIASGFSETERVKEVQRLGAGTYIRKPFLLKKIGHAVKEELNK